ncbi:hypothetical protein [Arcobacter sp. CECT 8985]|uniref:hypothetical protein n=1 Tax=Arcobacter sp. CECT 8985 TaxID=1935424 RepID=UPI00100BE64C|nr:hypothetical protein [Arcobacter sp. CECT 8985]RXJ88073.1 hypothetical protein CRU93_00295 [Arcobacter sp. CECT 8985]
MPKGKKTIIKDIKLLDNDEIIINGKEYVILENTKDIQTAKTMKISSNGNRILRFEDEKKKATIDVKREINIFKVTFIDKERAKKFNKDNDKKWILENDKKELIATANSFIKAREILAKLQDKKSENYEKQIGTTIFFYIEY